MKKRNDTQSDIALKLMNLHPKNDKVADSIDSANRMIKTIVLCRNQPTTNSNKKYSKKHK